MRKKCVRFFLCLGGAVLALALGVAGCYVWLFGWTWRSLPDFHASWTPAERSALTAFQRDLHQLFESELASLAEDLEDVDIGSDRGEWKSLRDGLNAIFDRRDILSDISAQLRRAAGTGQAAEQPASFNFKLRTGIRLENITLAFMAARLGSLGALEALVAHGADPNALFAVCAPDGSQLPGDTPLTPVINGRFLMQRKISWAERRRTADVLLQHGAGPDGESRRRLIALACDLPMVLGDADAEQVWLWALDRGIPMGVRDLCAMVGEEAVDPVLERVLREKLVDLNDTGGNQTVLQSLVLAMSRGDAEEAAVFERLERRLDLLLAAGARPERIPRSAEPRRPDESQEAFEARYEGEPSTAIECAEFSLEAAEEPELRERWQRVLEKLRAAAARSADATPATPS
ncbi:MAG: hypothetical protein ACI4OS_05500 [Akkermansia sp.]